jgi:hypothetical protein
MNRLILIAVILITMIVLMAALVIRDSHGAELLAGPAQIVLDNGPIRGAVIEPIKWGPGEEGMDNTPLSYSTILQHADKGLCAELEDDAYSTCVDIATDADVQK